jgi:PAS domain S-box-containing protein
MKLSLNMFKFLLVIAFSQVIINVLAHEKLDSLQKELVKETDDSSRLVILNKIAWELRVSNPTKSVQLLDSIVKLARQKKLPTCLANAYNHLGIIYANTGDYDGAIDWILKGHNISHEISDSIGIANALNNIGVVYWHRNLLDKALEYINLSMQIHQRANRFEYVGIAFNNIGTIMKQKGEFKDAITFFKQSIAIVDSLKDNIVGVKARLNLAEVYLKTGKEEKALNRLNQAEKLCVKYNNQFDLSEYYLIKGNYFELTKNIDAALVAYASSLSLSESILNVSVEKEALHSLGKLYHTKKEFEKAFLFIEKYHNLKDSLANAQAYVLLSKIDAQDKFDERLTKQNRISAYKEKKQKAEINYQKKVRNFLIISLFFLFVLGGLSILIYRQKLKNAKILASQRQEILMKNEILREQMEQDKVKSELIEIMNEENEILSLVAKETDNTVFILKPDGKIEWINEAFQRLSGYSPEEFKRNRGINIFDASSSESIQQNFKKCLESKKPVAYVSKTETKQKKTVWIHTTLTPVINEEGEVARLIAIDADITKIKEAEEQIALKNKEITWSLQYARKIQKALLPLNIYMESIFPQHFVINLPQNIVSGDFFWAAHKNDRRMAVVADSTGHGVPGAFMSVLGISAIQEIVANMEILEPAKILEKLRDKIVYLLNYQWDESSTIESLDIAICVIDDKHLILNYAGSNNPAFVLRDDVLIEMKPDKYFIWDIKTSKKNYTLKTFQLAPEDRIYMFTDGFSDQFGGEQDKKFSRRRLKKLLIDIYTLPLETQKDLLKMELKNWQGSNEQIDDIMVLAFEV